MTASGKTALLDAAETLFAERGYFGATVRDIAKAASVPLGLATYHFTSKDDLFRQVSVRRAPEICRALERALDQAVEAALPGHPSIEAILGAYVGTHLRTMRRSTPWKNYLRMTQQLVALGRRRELIGDLVRACQPTVDRYLVAAQASLPAMSGNVVETRFYFTQIVLAGILTDAELPRELCRKTSSLIDQTVLFCLEGFSARDDAMPFSRSPRQ